MQNSRSRLCQRTLSRGSLSRRREAPGHILKVPALQHPANVHPDIISRCAATCPFLTMLGCAAILTGTCERMIHKPQLPRTYLLRAGRLTTVPGQRQQAPSIVQPHDVPPVSLLLYRPIQLWWLKPLGRAGRDSMVVLIWSRSPVASLRSQQRAHREAR